MDQTRRTLIDRVFKGSVLSLSFKLAGASVMLTPGQARAQQVPLRYLSSAQAAVLDRLADAILPGAAEHGVTNFIDHQLGEDPNDALLLAKYFEVAPPYADFYAAGVNAATALARQSAGKALADLTGAELAELINGMSNPTAVLEGFPVFLFYMCLRSDAVDVVYGTPQGFARLNTPYMEHILPPEGWNG